MDPKSTRNRPTNEAKTMNEKICKKLNAHGARALCSTGVGVPRGSHANHYRQVESRLGVGGVTSRLVQMGVTGGEGERR